MAVTVEVGDTPGNASISRVDVSAWNVDADGNPTGAPVSVGKATTLDPANPPVITVTGLTDDVAYAFSATDTTTTGVTSPTSPVYLGGPQTPEVPLDPTVDSVFGRNNSLLVSWNPAESGGSPVTGYTVTATDVTTQQATTVTAAGTASTVTIPGLVNGDRYKVSVIASNKVGAGPPGFSDAQTGGASSDGTVAPQPPYLAGPPIHIAAGPPENVDGTAVNPQTLVVTWDPPLDDGGSVILGYTVMATAPGQQSVTVIAPLGAAQATLTGLVPDTEYTIAVTTLQGPAVPPPAVRTPTSKTPAANTAEGDPAGTSAPVTAAAGPVQGAQTVTLSAASIATITSVTPTEVVFTNPPAQVQNLVRHNIIVAGKNTNPLTQTGLLRSVDSVAHSGAVWTFTTGTATLDEAFAHLDLTATDTNQSASQATVKMLDPRFQATVTRAAGATATGTLDIDLSDKINNDPKTGEGKLPKGVTATAKLKAELSIKPDWTIEAGFKKDPNSTWIDPTSWTTFTYNFKAAATVKASVRGELGLAYKFESKKTPLATVGGPTSCVWVYGIAFCPKLEIYSQATVNGSVTFTFEATYERTVGGQVSRDASANQSTTDLTTDPTSRFKYGLAGAAKVTVSFPFELQILVYDVVGPKLVVSPSIVITADTAADPWLTVSAGLKVGVFFVIDAKAKKFNFGGNVYDGTFPLYTVNPGAFPGPSLNGGAAASSSSTGVRRSTSAPRAGALGTGGTAPTQYSVAWPAGCDPGEAVTWSMDAGSLGTVTATGLYSPPTPLPTFGFFDVINATTAGSPGCPATTVQAEVHYGPSEPGQPTNVAISPDGTLVTWAPPADTGGDPITSYIISVNGDSADPASSDSVLGTTAGTATSIQVPADRIQDIESTSEAGSDITVTAVNDRGAGPESDPSAPGSTADTFMALTATPQGLLSSTVTFYPTVTNEGPDDTTSTQIQFSYPAGFFNPVAPGNCTTDTASRTVTCTLAPIAVNAQIATPITLTVGLLNIGMSTFTATRTTSSPYPTDPNDGTDTDTCSTLTSALVSCSQ